MFVALLLWENLTCSSSYSADCIVCVSADRCPGVRRCSSRSCLPFSLCSVGRLVCALTSEGSLLSNLWVCLDYIRERFPR